MRSWRQGEKKQAARKARANYPALHWMLGMMLGNVHHLGHQVIRWLILYVGRRWPVQPSPCRLCNGTPRGWQHFEAHVEALGAPSYAELDSMLFGACKAFSEETACRSLKPGVRQGHRRYHPPRLLLEESLIPSWDQGCKKGFFRFCSRSRPRIIVALNQGGYHIHLVLDLPFTAGNRVFSAFYCQSVLRFPRGRWSINCYCFPLFAPIIILYLIF